MSTFISSARFLFRIFFMLVITIMATSCGGGKALIDQTPVPMDNYAFNFVQSEDLKPVLDLAAAEGKLVFVDVYTSWCLPCKMMDRDVFSNETTADIINANFISYKADAEQLSGLSVAFSYDVTQYPTLLFLDTEGQVLERNTGALYHSQFIEMASSAVAKAHEAKTDKI